jgi:hypothetical protein
VSDHDVEQEVWETLADIHELPATVLVASDPGLQNVAVTITLSDGSTVKGTAVIGIGS